MLYTLYSMQVVQTTLYHEYCVFYTEHLSSCIRSFKFFPSKTPSSIYRSPAYIPNLGILKVIHFQCINSYQKHKKIGRRTGWICPNKIGFFGNCRGWGNVTYQNNTIAPSWYHRPKASRSPTPCIHI